MKQRLIPDSTTLNSLTYENGTTLFSYLLEQPGEGHTHVDEVIITDVIFHEMTGVMPSRSAAFFADLAHKGAALEREPADVFLAQTKAIADRAAEACPNRPGKAKRFLWLIPRHGQVDETRSGPPGAIRIVETEIGRRFDARIRRHLDKAAATFHPDTPITVQDMIDLGLTDTQSKVFKHLFGKLHKQIQQAASSEEEDKADALHDQITIGLARALCPSLTLTVTRETELRGLTFADLPGDARTRLETIYCERMVSAQEANTETNSRVFYGRLLTYGVLEAGITLEQLLNFLHQSGVLEQDADTGLYHPQCCDVIAIDAQARTITIREEITSQNNAKAKKFKPTREPGGADGYPVTYRFDQLRPGNILDRDKARNADLQGGEVDRDNVKILLNNLVMPLVTASTDLRPLRQRMKAAFGEDAFFQMELNFTSSHRAKMPRDAATPYIRAHKDISRDRHNLGETSIIAAIAQRHQPGADAHTTAIGHDHEMAWAFAEKRLGDEQTLDYLLAKPGYFDLVLGINRDFRNRELQQTVSFCDTAGLMQIGRDIAHTAHAKKKRHTALATEYPFVDADYFTPSGTEAIKDHQEKAGAKLADRIAYNRRQPKLWRAV